MVNFFYASEASGSVLTRVIRDFVPDPTAATAARLTLQAKPGYQVYRLFSFL